MKPMKTTLILLTGAVLCAFLPSCAYKTPPPSPAFQAKFDEMVKSM